MFSTCSTRRSLRARSTGSGPTSSVGTSSSRVVEGSRTALIGPSIIAASGLVVSSLLGIAAGYIGGIVDLVISRAVDFMFSLPGLLIAIVVVSVVGGGYGIAVVVLSILNVQGDIRIVRSAAVKQRTLPYIESARTLGVPVWRIMYQHIFLNILPILVADLALDFGGALVALAGLAFLGLGAPGGKLGVGGDAGRRPGSLVREPCRSDRSRARHRAARGQLQPDRRLGLRPVPRGPSVPIDPPQKQDGSALLSVRRLVIEHGSARGPRPIVTGLDLDVDAGETIGIVGESGSGKSLTARAVMRLLPANVRSSGTVTFQGSDLSGYSERQFRRIRGSGISMLFQDPFTMLNPVLRAQLHVEEVLRTGERKLSRGEARIEAERRLEEVGLSGSEAGRRYPFQLSGGMRQRVALAAALAGDPKLLIADEPSTALDVTTEAEILRLLAEIQAHRGMGLVLITHDLRVAFSVCQRIYVLYAGSVVESASAAALAEQPMHPYSLGLMLSEPTASRRQADFATIEGSVPVPSDVASMCSFAPRCRWADDRCRAAKPALREVAPGRFSACIRLEEVGAEMAATRRAATIAAPQPFVEAAARPDPLLAVSDVHKVFQGRGQRSVNALRGVSIEIGPNESVGLVGESGSGKSTLGRCIVGLETPTSGRIVLGGSDMTVLGRLSRSERDKLRRTAQIIFQDPYSSLDPMQTVGASLREVLSLQGIPRD